jgi:hypothetical protein
MSSADGIVKQSASKKRYVFMGNLLEAYAKSKDPVSASPKQIAAEMLGMTIEECIRAEKYNAAQKRAHDLFKLGRLELVGDGLCPITGVDVHKYRISEDGKKHLRDEGLLTREAIVSAPPVVNKVAGRELLLALRSELW